MAQWHNGQSKPEFKRQNKYAFKCLANVATVRDETREFQTTALDTAKSGAEYRYCSLEDKFPGISRSQVSSAGRR